MAIRKPALEVLPGGKDDASRQEKRSDDDLMLLARGGSEGAFDALVRRHQRRVLEVAKKQVGSASLAEDVAQEAFVELYRYLDRYRPEGKLRVLLFRIVMNRCRMAQRSARRSRLVLGEIPERSVAPMAEDEVLRRERRQELSRAIDGLTPPLKSVVTLRFAADLTHPEIAEVLDIPVGTAKSRLFHGLAKLRESLKGGVS